MPGEMNSPAGGKNDYNNATLRPITIKQALDAIQPYPEAPYQIDSAEAVSITFVGQVRNISSQSTNVTYKIDDGTGEIEAKQWIDSMAGDSMDTDDPNASKPPGKNQIELNGYARVFGKLKSFGNKRFVGAHCVRPVTDINEVNYHLLEAAAVHLFFTRGPPGEKSEGEGGNVKSGLAGDGKGGADASMGGTDEASRGLPAMSPIARRVYNLLRTEPQSNEGLHAQLIAAKLSLPMPDVARAGDELLTAGVIFSTVDEQTWAILEF
ncbi:replication protein A, subunit RPA32 [Aspergillus heteromorphus CBS 117.55]|uniref:Replication protein A, subunit RPA32 n=1 Tax=Aspergillus heteromorphus CBS 117.55 TaxID=1448321 RepID=A0A317WVH1_9EURO|nr:replication protein A, subunit RPA32 [Aspergillus heteromorphus CBS 117.55]PWY89821.1 replication protein A, subunit RPA32 [Aspergillus heteromorphus CBS 117.55]